MRLVQDPHPFNLEKIRSTMREKRLSLVSDTKEPPPSVTLSHKEEIFPIGIHPSIKPRAPPSAAGTPKDPYCFDLNVVRAKVQGQNEPSSQNLFNNFRHHRTTRRSSSIPSSTCSIRSQPNISYVCRRALEVEQKAVILQSLLYIGAFVAVWGLSLAARIIQMERKDIPFTLLFLARVLNPLQGLFDMIVYCRPHVLSLRRRHPEYSWSKLIWKTVKTGGDNNVAGQGRRNHHGSRRASQKVKNKIYENHALRMKEIRERNERMARAPLRRTSTDLAAANGSDNGDADSVSEEDALGVLVAAAEFSCD